MDYKTYLKVFGVLFLVCSSLFYETMFSNKLFLSSDALSAKSVAKGIELSIEEDNDYPLWMPCADFPGSRETGTLFARSALYLRDVYGRTTEICPFRPRRDSQDNHNHFLPGDNLSA